MELRVLQPGDESLLEEFLLPRIESSMFLLSNLRRGGLVDRGQGSQGTYVAAFESGRIAAVAAHFRLYGNIILQAPAHLELLLSALLNRVDGQIKGLIGPDDQVRSAAAILRLEADDPNIQMNDREGLYALDLEHLAVPSALADDSVSGRRAQERDLDLMTRWRIDYCLEALGADDGAELREKCAREIEEAIRGGKLWVLHSSGEAVSCSGFNAALPEVVQIGGVWTPPDLRGRGYGRCAVAASLLDACTQGVRRAILFTGDENRPAICAYAALGFHRIGDYRLLLLRNALQTA